MDIENYVKRSIEESKNKEEIITKLTEIIDYYKKIGTKKSEKLSQAVYEEVKTTQKLEKTNILTYPKTNIHMGEYGVGSRGEGDFYVHSKIAEIISKTKTNSIINPTNQDDGGVVKTDNTTYITTAIDGIHSRLSNYPFLAGFHTARATLRDVCVMGAKPAALISDIHLADDGDIAKILDYTAGICTVSELTEVPLVSGSTLRVGGDMVLGDRLVGAVGAVGTSNNTPKARQEAQIGDTIIMTEGSGGGTITTTAIYNNYPEVIEETLNVQFIKAAQILEDTPGIHAMTDITNGGINGDANEINKSTKLGLHLYYQKIIKLINPKVLKMLKELSIDPLGVSIDSLMIITDKNTAPETIKQLHENNINADVIGHITNTGKTIIEYEDKTQETIKPKFREAAYTPTKKVVDTINNANTQENKKKIDQTTKEIINKKDNIVRCIKNKYEQ